MSAMEHAPLVSEDSDGDFIEEEISEVQRTARSKSFMRTVAAILVIGAVAAVVVMGPIDNPLHADMGKVQQLDQEALVPTYEQWDEKDWAKKPDDYRCTKPSDENGACVDSCITDAGACAPRSEKLTIMFWMRMTDANVQNGHRDFVFGMGYPGNARIDNTYECNGWMLFFRKTGAHKGDGFWGNYCGHGVPAPDWSGSDFNKWIHIAIVRTPAKTHFYKDGVLSTTFNTLPTTAAADCDYGTCPVSYGATWDRIPWGGQTKQLRIFKGAGLDSIAVKHWMREAKVKTTTITTTMTKNAKQVAQEAAADKAAKQAAADKAVADASTSLRTDLANLTSTQEKFHKELQTLETDIAATETAAQAVKNMAKNAADEMVVANKAVQKAHEEAIKAKDEEHKILAEKHKAAADKLLKLAQEHESDADKAKKALEGHQKNAKDAEVERKKEAATKDKEALTVAQALANKTQDAANLAKEAAAKAKSKAALTKAAADVAAQ